MRRLRFLTVLSFLALAVFNHQAGAAIPEPIKFMMNPHVHGDLIAFSYQGDIWIVERDGTLVRRLTNHLARDVSPRFSPDGRSVAFSSNRFGNNDVFLVPVEGGEPTQLTFHTTGDNVEGWTRDGRIMFATSRGVMSRFYSPLHTVSPDGDLPLPMEMDHALNEYVTLRVADSPDGSNVRDQRVQTASSLRNVRYAEWVEKNREFVERESDGKIAYVHIEGMNQPSLRIFEAEINRFWNAQGIIVDIRYNGGGNTDQQLLDILERRPYEYWNNRWAAPSSGRRPRQAIAGPKVMLVNARSGSDSEVTPLGFRDVGLGSIVGNPTAAAVIATGSYGLIHGGSIRTPGSLVVNYDPTKPHNHGINLENYGVAPDVFVWNSPEDELAGHDRELKAAVDEALRMLAAGLYQYQGGSR
ncbi:MAG: PD40 domain-containing protein [Gemmatimonadetes bacterium]|nr:PD40 domain-containing protein [Gemmatimonadota bacterium]